MGYCSICKTEYPGNGPCVFCGKKNNVEKTSSSSIVRERINENRYYRNQAEQNFMNSKARVNDAIDNMNRSANQYKASKTGEKKKSSVVGRLAFSIILGLVAATLLGSNGMVFWIVTILVFILSK